MEAKLDRTSNVSAKLQVEVGVEKVNQELISYYRAISKVAKIQGFRPGKAPIDVVRKLYSKEAASEISQRLVSDSLREVVKTHNLHIILPPTLLAVDSAEENKVFRFEAELDLKPEIAKVDLESLEIAVPAKPVVADTDVQKEIQSLQKNFSHHHELKEDRGAIETDLVKVKYEGFIGDQKIERASVSEQELPLGSGQVSEEFEKAILGMKKSETKDVEISFPEDHQVEEVRGKKVLFKLEVLGIQYEHTPEWNEERIQKVMPEAKTLAELEAEVRKRMETQNEAQYQKSLQDRLGDVLVEKYSFEVNQRQKKMTTESLLRDNVQRLIQMGLPKEEVEKQKEELVKVATESAEKQIRLSYILDAIAQQNDLDITEEDIEKRFEKTAALTGHSVAEIKDYYFQKEEGEGLSRYDRLRLDILDEKSLDYALSKVRIKVEG